MSSVKSPATGSVAHFGRLTAAAVCFSSAGSYKTFVSGRPDCLAASSGRPLELQQQTRICQGLKDADLFSADDTRRPHTR